MNKTKVKVFDAYIDFADEKDYYKNLGLSSYKLSKCHNAIINKKGLIKVEGIQPFKPLNEDVVEKDKYELDSEEKETLSMLKDSTKKAFNLYDSCKRKEQKYIRLLISKLDFDELYDGDDWKCNLSPIGRCLYIQDDCGEFVCAFCGEPEERK